ncbi:hypothetical protein T06_10280 [Trichinella sp. T6]|nr:hypothetical protein T06_10280 [Trichinella sp. T6]
MWRIFTELRQLIDHHMELRPSNFGLAHYALSFHDGSTQNGNVCCNDEISTRLFHDIRLGGPECNERNNKSLVSDISGLPGVSNELDNPTYETTTVIQNSNESRNSLLKEITLSRG